MKIAIKAYLLISLIIFYLINLVKANLAVAIDVVTPRHRMRPGIIKVPIDIKTDTGILLLNSLITMTPGTICLYLSDDNSYFYVHDMYITSKENSIKKIKELESRIIKLF
jgi:multicomponent Na+:H+ antiporter subunit E